MRTHTIYGATYLNLAPNILFQTSVICPVKEMRLYTERDILVFLKTGEKPGTLTSNQKCSFSRQARSFKLDGTLITKYNVVTLNNLQIR